jgi:hypothetical protein
MKKKITLLAAMLLISICAIAQVPQGMNYQAIARDNSGNPILNTHICLRFTIHSGSGSGPIQYQETDTITTNGFGLVTIKVGMGNVIQGIFDTIPWNSGNQYMQAEIDMNGACSTWVDMGTSQLLTVPYAMYAGNASSSNTISEVQSDTFNITTNAGQRIAVWAKGVNTLGGTQTVNLEQDNVIMDTESSYNDAGFPGDPFTLMYTSVPGAGNHTIIIVGTSGINNPVIMVMKF